MRRRCLLLLLLVGSVGVGVSAVVAFLLLGCAARVDVGIDPYNRETAIGYRPLHGGCVGGLVVFFKVGYFSALNW